MASHNFMRLLGYLKKYWPYVLASMFALVLLSAMDNLTPLIMKWIIDNLVSGEMFVNIVYYSILFIVVTILKSIIRFLTQYGNQFISNRLALDLRNDIFRALQAQSFTFYDKVRTGQLMARLTSDVDEIRWSLGMMLPFFATNLITFSMAVVLMLSLDPSISLYSFLMVPVLLLLVIRFANITGPLFSEIRKSVGNLSAVVQENLTGVKVVRAFSAESQEIGKFDKNVDGLLGLSLKVDGMRATYMPAVSFVVGATTSFVILMGGWQVIQGNISLGSLVALTTYLKMIAGPIRMVGFWIEGVRRSLAGANRIFEILDAPVAIKEKPNAIEVKDADGHVIFENVSFQYGDNPTLIDVSLEVRPGERVAVVGRTGSGKTTVLNLIPRFYDVSSGRVLIDGIDVRDFKISSLRRMVGIVQQEPFIFPTSIRDNITLGDKSFTQDEVEHVAKVAQIHEFIISLPNGYDTLVGERGVTLSGGQRQRISIARALLRSPKIVLLDDSTSQVDVATEKEIDQALEPLLGNRTAFVITNRISTAVKADRVIVLDKGKIVATGTHEQLLQSNELYREIFSSQIIEAQENDRVKQ